MLGHLVYNDYDFGELFFCHAPRPLLPQVQVDELSVAGVDGADYVRSTFKPVEIRAIMVLRDPKGSPERMNSIIDEVNRALARSRHGRLYLPDHGRRYYIASVAGTSSYQELYATAKLEVTFRASRPWRYGETVSLPLSDGKNAKLELRGNYRTWPTFQGTVASAASSTTLRNVTTGRLTTLYPNKVSTASTWGSSKALSILSEEMLATVGGETWPIGLNSTFWPLEGDCTVRVTGGSGELSYTEVWL